MLDSLLEKMATELNETRVLIRSVKPKFPEIDSNWKDSHTPIKPFGTNWGRGVLFQKGKELFAKIGNYGTSHAILKSSGKGMNVRKTFYFGFSDGVLYINIGSIGSDDFSRKELVEIVSSIVESGPLRGSKLNLSK